MEILEKEVFVEKPKAVKASFWLNEELADKLTRLSKKHNLGKSEIVRRLIQNVKE